MKAFIKILLLSALLKGSAAAQEAPAPIAIGVAWKQVYGGKKSEQATDACATHDGKIAVLGATTSEPAKDKDALFMLLELDGRKTKETLLGKPGDDELKAMTLTDDGGFVLAGRSGKAAWLVKLNEKGDTLWQKILPSAKGKAFFSDVLQTSDGGLLAVGGINTTEGRMDMWVCRMYADGQVIWQKNFGNRGADEARSVVEDASGNIAIAGITTQGKGSQNIWLFILDKNGKPLHHRIFGTRAYEEVNSITATSDGGFALAGFAKAGTDGGGLKDFWLIKTAADGEMVWQSTFGGRSNDSAFGMTETTDGGLLLVGYTFSHLIGANTSNALIIKVDAQGKQVWQTDALGGKDSDEFTAVAMLPDGGFVLAGTTSSKQEGAQGDDIWVMRLNREFDVNTAIPTQLSITDLKLESDKPGELQEGEAAFLTFTIENQGRQAAYDIDLVAQELANAKGISFQNFKKIGFLPAGQKRLVRLAVQGLEGMEPGDATFSVFCTDASRSRTQPVELKLEMKPLKVASNYLAIKWVKPEKGQREVKSPTLSIRLKTWSDKKLNRSHFTIILNGEPYKVGQKAGETGLADKGKARDVFTYEFTSTVELRPGPNTIEVVVDNGSKKVSSEVLTIEYSEKPNLHVIAIGIEHDDLKFTTQDAKDFAASFTGQDGKLFDKVYMTTLVSGARTRSGIFQTEGEVVKKTLRDLKDNYNYTIYEGDLLLLFVSSHGKTVNQDFKIIPTDFGVEGEKSLIDYRKDVVEQLGALPCRKLVFIDACHSGSYETSTADTGEAPSATTAKTLLGIGGDANTLASCRSDESSWEDAQWNNGAFTEAILGAFKNERYQDANGEFSPTNGDGVLTVGELFDYLQRRVPQMLLDAGKKGTQHPYMAAEQLGKVKDVAMFKIGN
jgi:hypothetical protein